MKKPDSATKDVAKSLHTVTAIYQVAGYILRLHMDASIADAGDVERALDCAMVTLELHGRPDPYGLRDRALALLLLDLAKTPEAKQAAADRVRSIPGKTKVAGRTNEEG